MKNSIGIYLHLKVKIDDSETNNMVGVKLKLGAFDYKIPIRRKQNLLYVVKQLVWRPSRVYLHFPPKE